MTAGSRIGWKVDRLSYYYEYGRHGGRPSVPNRTLNSATLQPF